MVELNQIKIPPHHQTNNTNISTTNIYYAFCNFGNNNDPLILPLLVQNWYIISAILKFLQPRSP